MRAKGIRKSELLEKARLANEEAIEAANEAEKIWADTADGLQ